MTDRYTQTIECTIKKDNIQKQILCIVCFLMGISLLAVAVVINLFVLIPAVVLLVGGGVFLHFYNNTPKAFTYDFSGQSLVIVKKDVINRTKRVLTLLFEDIISFEIVYDIKETDVLNACNDAGEIGVYQIIFKECDKQNTLYFKPDEYMIALINERIKNI